VTTTLDRATSATPEPTSLGAEAQPHAWAFALSWLGALALGSGMIWLGLVGARTLSAAGSLGAAISAARGRTVGPCLLVAVAVILVAEWRWPAVRRPVLARGHLVDAAYFALFAALIPALTVVQTGFAVEVDNHVRFLQLGRLPLVPRWLAVAAILVGIDAMNWLIHVANHHFATLWRFHALHHSQEEMGVLTTFRTHPLVHVSYLPTVLPVLLLGATGTVPNIALIIYGCLVTLPHANLRWTFGPVGKVLVSPAFHRLHHAAEPPLGVLGCNFGFVLSIWDRWTHLAVNPAPGTSVATGLVGRPVPVEQDARRFVVATFVTQLLQPFSPRGVSR
jgi:sterol desaturase/sphingolipid hydroxylase (fatty acid hydroxylase superfamily)